MKLKEPHELPLHLIFRKTDHLRWSLLDYAETLEDAEKKLEEMKYRDNQRWLSNRLVASFGQDIYVPVFKYQIRRVK